MKYEKLQAPKGVREYLPPESSAFEWVRENLIAPAKASGYKLMELPVFEDTNLFSRGVGESTDVVSKEMYTFEDRGGRSITLRPEGTAGVMRAVIEQNLDRGQLPVKVWYSGQFFRAERPQAGQAGGHLGRAGAPEPLQGDHRPSHRSGHAAAGGCAGPGLRHQPHGDP